MKLKNAAGLAGISLGALIMSTVATFGVATVVTAAPVETPTTVGLVAPIISVQGASGVLS